MNDDVRHLRALLEKDPNGTVVFDGTGYRAATLLRILDRLEELEWIVSLVRKEQQL